MILKVFTKDDSPENREAIALGKAMEEEGYAVEYVDLGDEAAGQTAELYDIYSSPVLAVTQEDGRLVEIWREGATASDIKNFLRL